MLNKKLILPLGLLFVVSAAAGWLGTTWATPRVIMHIALARIEAKAGTPNRILKASPINEHAREVVRPSPDLLYSLCAFDLSEGDVSVTVGSTSGYWSISFYDRATDNFDIRGYGSSSNRARTFRITRKASGVSAIISPSNRGLALIRRRVGSQADLRAALEAQKEDNCGAYSKVMT